jgi:haloacetate dehalogenase
MFEGFETRRITVRGAELNLRVGGDGPPVLLLHGFPQTHLAWHRVAPVLAERFTLVVPDLPGYGASRGLAPTPEAYSKRNLAAVMVELMDGLGHRRFALAGHDRGGRIGYRLALDHPGVLTRFAPVDILPTLEVWEAMDWQAALGGYHWLLLAQPAPLPETLVGADGPDRRRHGRTRRPRPGDQAAGPAGGTGGRPGAHRLRLSGRQPRVARLSRRAGAG